MARRNWLQARKFGPVKIHSTRIFRLFAGVSFLFAGGSWFVQEINCDNLPSEAVAAPWPTYRRRDKRAKQVGAQSLRLLHHISALNCSQFSAREVTCVRSDFHQKHQFSSRWDASCDVLHDSFNFDFLRILSVVYWEQCVNFLSVSVPTVFFVPSVHGNETSSRNHQSTVYPLRDPHTAVPQFLTFSKMRQKSDIGLFITGNAWNKRAK